MAKVIEAAKLKVEITTVRHLLNDTEDGIIPEWYIAWALDCYGDPHKVANYIRRVAYGALAKERGWF